MNSKVIEGRRLNKMFLSMTCFMHLPVRVSEFSGINWDLGLRTVLVITHHFTITLINVSNKLPLLQFVLTVWPVCRVSALVLTHDLFKLFSLFSGKKLKLQTIFS